MMSRDGRVGGSLGSSGAGGFGSPGVGGFGRGASAGAGLNSSSGGLSDRISNANAGSLTDEAGRILGSGALSDRLKARRLRQPAEPVMDWTYHLDQEEAPLADALTAYRLRRMVSFDVPGHKKGKGNPELTDFLGLRCLAVDANSMKMLDNLIHPVSVIKEAEELAADAFGAGAAFFMVNGTSSAVQAMVMGTLQPGEKIIMPRNVHRSAINALILSRGVPIYVNPGLNEELGVPLGMSVEAIAEAIAAHPDAKAVLVNNPTYYGVCANLEKIVEIAHAAGMRVLVDEAHGTHFYFSPDLPTGAMRAGADLAAVSLHKTGGSLTQSSILLMNKSLVDQDEAGYMRQIINLTQTTSASYLLMVSLDISRRTLATRGPGIMQDLLGYAQYAREEIDKIGGYMAFDKSFCDGDAFFDFDLTKLSIHTRTMGLTGLEVYDLLRDDYNIQVEFGDLGNFLAILSLGDRPMAIERLIAALQDIRRQYGKPPEANLVSEYIPPVVKLSPAEAFYAKSEQLPLKDCLGRISTEFIMCYPPGIPILAPGELVTPESLEYIAFAKSKGASMTGTQDLALENLYVAIE